MNIIYAVLPLKILRCTQNDKFDIFLHKNTYVNVSQDD
jgi:hypothetical protein